MTIHYDVQPKDYISFQKIVLRKSKINILYLIMLAFANVLMLTGAKTSVFWIQLVITNFLLALVILFCMNVLPVLGGHLILMSNKNNDTIGDFTVELQEDGIFEKGSRSETKLMYSTFDRIYYYRGCILLCVGLTKGLIISIRGFRDANHLTEFLDIVCEKTSLTLTAREERQARADI